MKLFTKEHFDQLIENGRRQKDVFVSLYESDLKPVVKLFNPGGRGIWLLTHVYHDNHDIAFGLINLDEPVDSFKREQFDYGCISLAKMESMCFPFGPVVYDPNWKTDKTLSDCGFREIIMRGLPA